MDFIDHTHRESVAYIAKIRRDINALAKQRPHTRPVPPDFMRSTGVVRRLQSPKKRAKVRRHAA